VSLFQLIVFDLQLRGTRIAAIAEALKISRTYLDMILRGDRRLSAAVSQKAAALFRVSQRALSYSFNIRDLQQIAARQAKEGVKCPRSS
jgi:transcriptional regulator with XRE-family HTH domain